MQLWWGREQRTAERGPWRGIGIGTTGLSMDAKVEVKPLSAGIRAAGEEVPSLSPSAIVTLPFPLKNHLSNPGLTL